MFDQIKQEVLYTLIPNYVKTLCDVHNLAGCETPTVFFMEKLAGLLLPDKLLLNGEPQDQKRIPEEQKEPLQQLQQNGESSFVADL